MFLPTTLLAALLVAVSGSANIQVIRPTSRTSAIFTTDRVYFTDPSEILRTRQEAKEFCESEGGELAKIINRRIYDVMRVSLSVRSTYWIDGIDKNTTDRFALEQPCMFDGEYFNFAEMNPRNVDLSPKQCLSLVKGNNSIRSRIQAVDCEIPYRVLCAFKSNGCVTMDSPARVSIQFIWALGDGGVVGVGGVANETYVYVYA